MKTDRLLIKNCLTFNNGKEDFSDILIEGGVIKAVEGAINEKALDLEPQQIIDAHGLCAAPGLVDMHVHLRDPGQTHKEDIITGCAAAAAGGVTSVAAMPNTRPAADNPETVRYMIEKSQKTGVHVYPIAAVTKEQNGKRLTDFAQLKAAGAIAFSDDGRPVISPAMMSEAIKAAAAVKAPVISHCEDMSLANGGIINEGAASQRLKVAGIPNTAEAVQAAREAVLADALKLPVHIAHVSAAETVDLIRDAKRRGVKITCETCPHYFSLDESLTLTRDADYRMNPPLRTKRDIAAVIKGLQDGTIDAIVTDHAPHTAEEKSDFESAPNGVVGLETSLAVGITYLVRPGLLTMGQLIYKMTAAPAKILGIPAGTLNEGASADIVLFDPNECFEVDPKKLHSKSKNTPYKGMTLYGRVKYTISEGKIIFSDN